MNFFTEETKFSENLALRILDACGIESSANNEENICDVDIKTRNGKKIDVQLSANFARYGDFRLDIVSAFSPACVNKYCNSYRYMPEENFLQNFSRKFKCQVVKAGKIMRESYLDFFFILFYNYQFKKENPDFVFIISAEEMIRHIRDRKEAFFDKIKINDKSHLDDKCGSAFIPVKVEELKKNCHCFFGSLEDLYARKEFIRDYIS